MLESKACVRLLLLAGLLGRSRSDLHSLWRTSPLEFPIFKATMSKNRFDKIIACLRFDDKNTREQRKKADKLKACYKPGLHITIDEQLLGFRGKRPFRQFIPKKPSKYGLKFWQCVECISLHQTTTWSRKTSTRR